MNIFIYKIIFSKSAQELNDDYERLSENEKEKIANMDAESFFDYEELDKYICFVISTPLEITKYLKILNDNFITHQCDDISELVLKSEFVVSKELDDKINSINSIKYGFFKDDVDKWMLSNLDIDTVLDRISKVGIDGLNEIEKQYLKQYN
jgi:hypothetical protein